MPGNISKHSIETSSRHCFCSIVSKRGIHLAHTFLMSKFSGNMRFTALFEINIMSARSHTFSRQPFNNILWIFFVIFVVVTSFSQSLRCSSWQLVRPRSNSVIHTEKNSSIKFIELFKSWGYRYLRNQELSMIFHEYFAFYSEKFCKCSRTLYRECLYPQLLKSSINFTKLFFSVQYFIVINEGTE